VCDTTRIATANARISRPVSRSKPRPNLRGRSFCPPASLSSLRQKKSHQRPRAWGTEPMVAWGTKPADRYDVPLCTNCHANQDRGWEAPLSGARCASILLMWLFGCGQYQRMSRPGSVLSFERDNGSIWRRHWAERRDRTDRRPPNRAGLVTYTDRFGRGIGRRSRRRPLRGW
jgi:hypothetical protein